MVTAILKFKIRNTFAEWEQAFYSHQPIARAVGMFEIYHGHEPDDEKKVCVVLNTLSSEHMQKFIKANGTKMAESGHILESTISEIYVN